ncbi:hypothetical protein LO771_08630 [Streptacidiphilus sp. ASG 303]|uniref:hypothetical protein n=1 Tax=Streptacidiphilus sp. ASG 303 TaxID=2896847 RepID=UPI001E380903|nr:hypothetical protein [Streptacidiphilus sp. ASG 303]MCD0482464.1 hypothetical protein [Streptacidiphilus sp. ASG 303]
MQTTIGARTEPGGRRPRPGEARRAATRVIEAWAADHCLAATGEELEELAQEVVKAVRRAVTPRVVPPAHGGLTSKPGADADAARRIAARLEAELAPAGRRPEPRDAAPRPTRRPLHQPHPRR